MPVADGWSDLTMIWALLIAFAVFVYVVLDGFDLGLGMLFAVERDREARNVMMNSVAPVWDGNETWLVFGGGGLFAVFPLAYATILPALYVPLVTMLLALVFRGVAFEFRWRHTGPRNVWNLAFIAGSALAALCQGVVLGAVLQGIAIDPGTQRFVGGWLDWLSPFSVLCGLAVATGYMLLGACWLIMKTTGGLQDRMRALAWPFGLATVGFIGAVTIWTPFLQGGYYWRWFDGWRTMPWMVGVGTVIALVTAAMFRSLHVHRHEYRPFVLALALFALCFVGLGICLFPYIVPTTITIWEAAAPPSSQIFMLVGSAVLVPMILAYTGYAYWTFRGKIDADAGYH